MTWLRGYTRARPSFQETVEYTRRLGDEWTELIKGPGLALEGEWIQKNTYPDYWTDDLFLIIDLWDKYKRFGLPFSPSWACNPAWMIDAIDTCEKVIAEHKKG